MGSSDTRCVVHDPHAPSYRRGALALLGSGASTQLGAASGALAFAGIGPPGVVAVRQLVAALLLLPVARPPLRRLTWAQWWPALLLGAVFATMNLALYTSIERIGLGLAVTLEFLGPLAVALLGSGRRRDLLIAAAAGVGVYVLVLPDGSSDGLGIALGLVAAALWALYILLNRTVGRRLGGLQAPAIASGVAALVYLPVLGVLVARGQMTGMPLLFAIGAGVLASAVPYTTDLLVLRTLPPHVFGVMMSAQPGLAALAGLLLLGQIPHAHEWLGIVIVAGANLAAVTTGRTETARGVPSPSPAASHAPAPPVSVHADQAPA